MRVIYVDDELPARDNFYFTAADIPEIESIQLFGSGEAALDYVRGNTVDAAFLDMEMPGIHGLALAQRLREICADIRVIFVTAFSRYAMEAWKVNATGYVLKPYTADDIRGELNKCVFRPLPSRRIVIRTIPTLALTVDRRAVQLPGTKVRELFALLVDRGDSGVTVGDGIACLWPDRPSDAGTQSLFRMTYKRLADALEKEGIGHIVVSSENRRYIRTEEVDCDLYRILSGDRQAADAYQGAYLEEYPWAEERNSRLYRMLLAEK